VNRIQVATTGLFAAWMAHDLEELATMSDNSRILMTRLPDWLPVPTSIRNQGIANHHLTRAVAAVGLVVAAAAVRGSRTQGRSAFYQNALLGFGLHGLGHIGVSLLTRAYTSGVATSPTIVIPFWLWATRALHQAGVPNRRSVPAAAALAVGSIAGGHLVASLLTKIRSGTVRGQLSALRRCIPRRAQHGERQHTKALVGRCWSELARQVQS
jgi:Protein of unknown function with HXXEE motif